MPECEEQSEGHAEQSQGRSHDTFLVSHYPFEGFPVVFFQPYREEGFFRYTVSFHLVVKHVAAENRCQCQCHEGRSEECGDECHSERCKHASLHSGQEEKRYETDDDDEGGVQDRHPDFFRSFEHYFQYGQPFRCRQCLVRPDMFPDIFHIHYGIVHERAYGYGQTSETHGVDGHAHPVQCQYGDQYR